MSKPRIRVEIKNGRAKIFTPMNPKFVEKIKMVGGRKWNPNDRCWEVPEETLSDVRALMMECYGETDLPSTEEKVTVRLTFLNTQFGFQRDIVVMGKVLSHAWGKASGATHDDDVTYLKGGCNSGGSKWQWYSGIETGSVVKLRNVPKSLYDREKESDEYTAEIVDEGISRDALLEERERLLKRIAEIDKILSES